ncbi:MAG: prolyl oligopeptidase family serine peptidase [Fimbriiglobus sp.]
MKCLCLQTAMVLLIAANVAVGQGTQADFQRAARQRETLHGLVFNQTLRAGWSSDGKNLAYSRFNSDGKEEQVLVDLKTGKKSFGKVELARPQPRQREQITVSNGQSADGEWQVTVKEHSLYHKNLKTQAETLLVKGDVKDSFSGGLYPSPDSKWLVAFRRKPGGDRRVTLVASSPKTGVQPETSSYSYLKPGDAIPELQPYLFDMTSLKEIALDRKLFDRPWDMSFQHWTPDSKTFHFFYNPRGHQYARVISVDPETGKASTLIDEKSGQFFDYTNKLFLRYLDDTNEILWMSERSGYNHLYLLDMKTGAVKNAITRADWVVRGVENVDVKARTMRLRIMGYHAEQDPYHIHYARVNFDGTGFTLLTDGDGSHQLQVSPDGQYAVDTYSRVDAAPVHVLRRMSDGQAIDTLETADLTKWQAAGGRLPERFAAPGRDGKTLMYGIIVRPSNFDPAKKYKVIENIYAGPHDFHVAKRFNASVTSMKYLAELGFIVVMVDGMGTNWRSKAFHDVCHKNLGDSGLPDHIAWLKAAAKKHAEMDISTGVGIYGGSAGGQSSTRALLAHPEFYKVAVSDCGCHDNRVDKIWWNEMWMSWPIGPHYAEQSNVTQAHKLQGKLLLIVGELDKNVDPSSTLQVADALIKADKDFDLLVVPGGGHGIAESAYGSRRRADFFLRHLYGVEPRR